MESVSQHTIRKFAGGSKEAFELLFHELYPHLLPYAIKILSDRTEAEDMVQEAFVELWNAQEKFETFSQVRAFLYLTIKNRCFNHLKHRRVIEKHQAEATPESEFDFESEILRSEMAYQLRSAIRNLPEQRQKIILLSLQGMKNHEIADFMEISVNTVKQQKKLAYKTLRDQLGKQLLFLSFLFFSS